MTPFPREKSFDSSLALWKEGYTFIPDRCRRLGTDVFRTRLMLRPVICASGEEAARIFYAPERFTRRSAIPFTTLMLLQDFGSVQTLDGAAHRQRKQLFMGLMHPAGLQRLAALFEAHWRQRMASWEKLPQVTLHHEVEQILCRTACDWAGIPLAEQALPARTAEFSAMIDGAGTIGPRNWKGMWRRRRTEHWMRGLVEAVRQQRLHAEKDSALQIMALHRDADGSLLDARIAAVELINLVRPTVAVARYITFAALAMHHHPHCRPALAADDPDYLECFVQEVRRFYPFFPAVGGRVLQAFDWRGHHFAQDTWVVLDIYGTNHDPRIWGDPQHFRPERFRERETSPFDFIPQGGGDFDTGHRCAGEWATRILVQAAVRLLAAAMRYTVPPQDLEIDLSRMPALPASRFLIQDVRPARAGSSAPGSTSP